jgi:hypothetical protein
MACCSSLSSCSRPLTCSCSPGRRELDPPAARGFRSPRRWHVPGDELWRIEGPACADGDAGAEADAHLGTARGHGPACLGDEQLGELHCVHLAAEAG